MARKPTAKSTAAKSAGMINLTGEVWREMSIHMRGWVIVHNDVAPARRGFHAWFERRSANLVKCTCAWAPQLGRHYRMKRVPVAKPMTPAQLRAADRAIRKAIKADQGDRGE